MMNQRKAGQIANLLYTAWNGMTYKERCEKMQEMSAALDLISPWLSATQIGKHLDWLYASRDYRRG